MEECIEGDAYVGVKQMIPAAMEKTTKPEEATVCFSVEELDSSEDPEKECNKDAEAKVHQSPSLVGYLYVKPETVPKIQRGEKLCVSSDLYTHRRKRNRKSPSDSLDKDDGCQSPDQSTADPRRSSPRIRRKPGRCSAVIDEETEPREIQENMADSASNEEQEENTEIIDSKSGLTSKVYTCGECGDCFEERAVLRVHKATHTEERNLTPTRHRGVQTGERVISPRRSRKPVTYTSDKIMAKRTELKGYVCKECGKCFTQNASLIVHGRTHTGERPHTCKICLKSFISGSYLVMHQRVHTGERPYACNDCGKRFISSSNLIIHQRVHTGEKPYLCTECGKCFGHSSHLVRHQKVHTGERPYTCAECGKSFSRSSHLVRHQTIHMRGPANPTV
ncbi:uncharacterized protein [Engystomops pustulosus]|uniref:uncharacterized protein isoform X2 n=1 Tax=Engystomops pustulosus TaxID=76066 RepID=UPI003AFAABA8